jgi:hypothetical protein
MHDLHQPSFPIDPIPMRIVIPARVAFDVEAMSTVLVNLGERLGCGRCISGANCFFQLERDFVVDPATLAVGPIQAGR